MTQASSRLDIAMVTRGLTPSRSRARDLIARGLVQVNGTPATKPAVSVTDAAKISVEGPTDYVSRGALKLEAALAAFEFNPAGRTCLDIGASTGGFTEVLLARDAEKVYAIDVGRDQLHARLRDDPRVTAMEGFDARDLSREHVPDAITAIVADVSFISLEKVLPSALSLATETAWLVALIKPQFEAGRDAIGKGGIVRDEPVRLAQATKIETWINEQAGWTSVGVIPSPIEGGSGNHEFLIGARAHD